MMKRELHFGERGEFMACVHTGHEYDASGNITREGIVLRSSAWGKNLITLGGFNALLDDGSDIGTSCVVGAGNANPDETDSLLQSYLGVRSSGTISSRQIFTTAVSGYYRIETVYRSTFNPGALGSGNKNVTEAGMTLSGAPNSATPLFSRGLLTDESGVPTAVSLDASTEYLDVYWKHTRFIPAEFTGTEDIDILGTDTPHDYIVRPARLDPTASEHAFWWGDPPAQNQIKSYSPSNGTIGSWQGSSFFTGNISNNLTSGPSGTGSKPTSTSWLSQTPDTKQRRIRVAANPTAANLAGGIRSLALRLSCAGYQIQFDPTIQKAATPARVLTLDFDLILANH